MNIGIFIVSVLLFRRAWPHRRAPGIHALMLLMVGFCIASFFTLNTYMATSFSAKVIFSRLRYTGFAFVTPAGLLFFAAILGRWRWLQKRWVTGLLFLPGLCTFLIALGLPDSKLLVYDHVPFEYGGVSVLMFRNGPWFSVHYYWSCFLTLLMLGMFAQEAVMNPARRKDVLFLSSGVLASAVVDNYGVLVNSISRWLMVGAGTFAICEAAILYVAHKTEFFGLRVPEDKTQKRLRDRLEYQKKLLALLSHDLSGNIHQQVRLAQLLRGKLQDLDGAALDSLASSSQASKDLLQNILNWVRTQGENGFEPRIEDLEANAFLENCVDSVKAAYPDRNVAIAWEVSEKSSRFRGDPEMLASVLRNLLSNSLQATQDGKSILIKAYKDADHVRFDVDDEGRGMSAEEIQMIWKHPGGKPYRSGAGYGVGLSLARHFVELHLGSMDIQSTSGHGTRVSFSIPG